MPHAQNGSAVGGDDLGPIEYKRFHHSLERVDKLVFIRHGEKLDEQKFGKTSFLSNAGRYRAENLIRVFGKGKDALLMPNVIYAMKQGKHTDNSNRPYLTVLPLASELGMMPNTDDRTKNAAGIFDNTFHDREDLVEDVIGRARNGEYDDMTLLFCWEHKNIPYIVALLGLADEQLFWGAVPDSGADDRTNFSAVWVFTPRERSLQLFKQFEVAPELGATSASGAAAFTLVEPQGGYKVGAPPLSLNPYDK